jgi:iron complex outermembrane receptor protein
VTAYDKTPGETVLTNAVYVGLKSDHFRFSVFRNSSRTPSANIYTVENSIHNDAAFIGHGLTVVSGQYNFDAGPFSFQSTLTASNYQLDPYSSFRNMFTAMEPGYKYAESQSSKGEQQVVWSASSKLTVTGGFSYETAHAIPWSTDLQDPMDTKSSIRGKIRGTPFDADFFSVHYTNTAAYLQIQWTPVESFSATVGGRYDYNSRFGSTTNPRLGLVYHAGKAGTFKLLYGQSFLAPSPLLAYSHFGSFFSTDGGTTWQSFFWRLPNPNLKPMESKSLELSYRVLLSDSVAVSAVLYQNKLKNLFSLGYTSNETYKGWNVATVERRINLGTEKLNGGTVQLDYSRSFGSGTRVGAYASYSFVDGKVDPREDGHEIEAGLIAPKTIRVGLDLGWGPWTFTPRYTKVGEQRLDDTYTDAGGGVHRYTLDGYGNLDFTLRFLGVPHAEFFARVSNATDARYRNINHEWKADGSTGEFKGAPQDPRRWSVGVTARF